MAQEPASFGSAAAFRTNHYAVSSVISVIRDGHVRSQVGRKSESGTEGLETATDFTAEGWVDGSMATDEPAR
jgi:hypothetical protein